MNFVDLKFYWIQIWK